MVEVANGFVTGSNHRLTLFGRFTLLAIRNDILIAASYTWLPI